MTDRDQGSGVWVDIPGITDEIDSAVQLASQKHFRLGFQDWEGRALSAVFQDNHRAFFELRDHLHGSMERGGIRISADPLLGALSDAFKMNPRIGVQGNMFVGEPALRAPFVETLTKTLISRTNELSYSQREEVANFFCRSEHFYDGRAVSPEEVFPDLVTDTSGLAGNAEDNYWAPDKSDIPSLDDVGVRGKTEIALKEYFEKVFGAIGNLLPEHPCILEIGPGWGGLYKLLPEERRSSFEFLEWNPHLIDAFTNDCPEIKGSIREGNAYDLLTHYPEGSLDAVVFFTASSSFYNLDHIMDQSYRALRPGGVVASFHDATIPNDQQVGEQLTRRGMHGIHNLFWARDPLQQQMLRSLLIQDETDGSSRAQLAVLASVEDWDTKAAAIHRLAAIENMYEYFYEWFQIEMAFRGFKTVSPVNCLSTSSVTPRREAHSQEFLQYGGFPSGPYIRASDLDLQNAPSLNHSYERLSHKYVIEHAKVWSILGQKPAF